MKKIVSVLLAAACALGALGLTACNPNGGKNVEEDAQKVVFYARMFEDYANDHLDSLVNEFNGILDDGIQIDVKFFPKDDAYNTAIEVARSNSSQLDIYMVQYADLYTQVKNGYAAPLNDYFEADVWDDVYDYVLDMVTFDEKYYAFPWLVEPGSMFFYRKDILQSAGVTEPPTSWAALLEACKAVKPKMGVASYPMGMPTGSSTLAWSTWGMQQSATGGLAVDDSWLNSRMDADGWKDMARLFYDMAKNRYASIDNITPLGYEDLVDALCEGKLAMCMGGSWSIARIMHYYPEMADKIGVAVMPTKSGDQTGITSTNGGWTYLISADSQYKDLAATFLKWMFTDSAARTASYFEVTYNSKQPPQKSVYDYLATKESDVDAQWTAVMNEVANNGIPEATYPWDISHAVGMLFSAMQVDCDKNTFDNLYASRHATAIDEIDTIMRRSSYTANPKYRG